MKKNTRILIITMLAGSLMIPLGLSEAAELTLLTMDNIQIPLNGNVNGYLWVKNVKNLGSLEVTISYNPNVVKPTIISEIDLLDIVYYINEKDHVIKISWFTEVGKTGNFCIASISFEPASQAKSGDNCQLTISGNLFDATPTGNNINHDTQHGSATIMGTVLKIDNISIPLDGTGQGYLRIKDVIQLGSFNISVTYNPTVVIPINVNLQNLNNVNFYINTALHKITFNWVTTGSVSGDFIIAKITFQPAPQATVGASGNLVIDGKLYDSTPDDNLITFVAQNGVATITSSQSGGSSGGGGGGSTSANNAPTAHFTISETSAMVGTPITFDASLSADPDLDALTFKWNFGDGTTSTEKIVVHTYTSAKTYTVKLTVTDSKGATDDDTKTIEILKGNYPPSDPIIQGTFKGRKNTALTFSIKSTDSDGDNVQYTITWGDGETLTTEFYASNLTVNQTHTWTNPGKYMMTVSASDGQAASGTTNQIIMIDTILISGIGYLIDIDGDGVYDECNIEELGKNTMVQQQEDGSYLIDRNNDQIWDFVYDPATENLSPYTLSPTKGSETGESNEAIKQFFIIGVIAIVSLLIIYAVYRRSKKRSINNK